MDGGLMWKELTNPLVFGRDGGMEEEAFESSGQECRGSGNTEAKA